jgi:hypothetical protein
MGIRLRSRHVLVRVLIWTLLSLPCFCFIGGTQSALTRTNFEALSILNDGSHLSSTRRFATSSSDLKGKRGPKSGGKKASSPSSSSKSSKSSKSKSTKTFSKDSVVSRLSQAAARASAAADEREKQGLPRDAVASSGGEDSSRQGQGQPKLGSLRELTKVIDQQLQAVNSDRKNLVADSSSVLRPARDSMSAVIKHNFRQPPKVIAKSQRHIAAILAKPLMQDQVTVEYANRIRRLVTSMRTENYVPDVVAFIGGIGSDDNCVAEADAGYVFFRHLCSSQHISLENVTFHLERTSIEEDALQHLAQHVQQYVPAWREAIQNEYDIAPAYDYLSGPPKRPKKLHIQFSLISSEYHLCQLHDIHARSPGQSKLSVFENWGRVETSWSYLYATTARVTSDHPALAFCGKSFQTVQELVPVLLNLRGVVDDREFFQRDNYRVLVAARRSLVTDMEGLYRRQPSLQAVHQLLSGDNKPLDVTMESALLSLGRCLDLVRPAGLLTETVSAGDWIMALSLLEQAVSQISQACDPDQPLDPAEWGSMSEADEDIIKRFIRNDDMD